MRSGLHRDLLAEVEAGNVSRRERGALAIYNYTASCAFERRWTPTTRVARGLILEESTSLVVARPFEKFFNIGEMPETAADALPWDEPFEVTEKLDGSLGIVFSYGGRWDIATRGAFESDQAAYAREHLLPRYDFNAFGFWVTALVEIVYPDNRIVVDYGDREELVFLSAICRKSGLPLPVVRSRKYAVAAGLEVARDDLRIGSVSEDPSNDVDDIDHEPNTEGFVLYWPSRNLRVKIKAPDYVAAHRCLDMVRPKRVLELMAEGRDDDVHAQLPDHVRPAFNAIRQDLDDRIGNLLWDSGQIFDANRYHLDESRKAFALAVKDEPAALKPLIFCRADGKTDEELLAVARKLVAKRLGEDATL